MRWILKNGTVLTPAGLSPVDVIVEGETILWVGPDADPSPGDHVLFLNGQFLLPGFVDMHTHLHLRVGDQQVADNFASGTAAALAGGTTTVVEYVTPDPEEDFHDAISRWEHLTADTFADVAFHLCIPRVTRQLTDSMGSFVDRGISGFKVFLAYPGRLMLEPWEIRQVMDAVLNAGGVLFVHAEEGHTVETLREDAVSAGRREPAEHARTRPPETEIRAVEVIRDLVRETRCPTVIVHVSCARTADLIAEARFEGLPLFGETCPHYLWLTDRFLDQPFERAAHYICSPPLRSPENAQGLWDALSTGALEFVATDHAPFASINRLAVPSFDRVPNGMAGIGQRFGLTFGGGPGAGRFGMERLARLLSTNPAMICGLYPRKGAIAPGSDADLVVLDPFGVTDLSESPLAGACDFNPWEGMKTRGHIAAVMSRGEWVARAGTVTAEPGRGRIVRRRKVKPETLITLQGENLAWISCP